MLINIDSSDARPAAWILAAAAAALGATVLYDSALGVNWLLWILSACFAVAATRFLQYKKLEPPLLILFGWACLLAFAIAITTAESIHVLVIMSDAMLLGLAIVVIGADRWRSLSVSVLPTVPFLAPLRVWYATLREAIAAPARLSALRGRPALRGALLSVPIALVLLALLRNADPVIGWLWSRASALLPDWSLSGRIVFFLFLFSLTLGAASLAGRQSDSRIPALPTFSQRAVLGFTEQRMLLITITVILWIFVALQLAYVVHPPPSLVDSGVTFAEYARRGFAEITVAVTLVGAILMILEATRPADLSNRDASHLTRLTAALLIALEVALVLAFRRVILYERAYGFTTARVYAQAYMFAVAIALAALWLEVRAGRISINLGRRLAVIGLATFTAIALWNHEAWIVNQNIDRARETGNFDNRYLVRLSDDVVPTLIARRAELPANQRPVAEQWAACSRVKYADRWFEYNVRRSAARRALTAAGLRCTNPDYSKDVHD